MKGIDRGIARGRPSRASARFSLRVYVRLRALHGGPSVVRGLKWLGRRSLARRGPAAGPRRFDSSRPQRVPAAPGLNCLVPSRKKGRADWLESLETAVLGVPSAVIPQETNYLLNPSHPDFVRIRLNKPEPFAFDPRMWKKG